MRADRLLSLLLHLQTRGRSTTEQLSREFEVSQRTILRDLYALRVAGFPLYTERGPHGGCYLHEDYRSTLTQLTADEVATFFLSSIHQPLDDLGLSAQLRAARLKLRATTSEARQAAANRLAQRVVIDSLPWRRHARPAGPVSILYEAAMGDRWARATFVRRHDVENRCRIAVYGLATKAGGWNVVWAGEDGMVRVDDVAQVRQVAIEADHFARPPDFDLESFWRTWSEERENAEPDYRVRLRVRTDALHYVQGALGVRRRVVAQPEQDSTSRTEIDVFFTYFEEARRLVLSLGGAVEVVEPAALRASVADFARQIAARYPDELPQS